MASCDNCKGTGSVPDADGYSIPCRVCKQKAKVICSVCRGGRYAQCATCNGLKVRKTIPTGDYKSLLEEKLCKRCSGTGGVFTKVLFPCPFCEGLGRFPSK